MPPSRRSGYSLDTSLFGSRQSASKTADGRAQYVRFKARQPGGRPTSDPNAARPGLIPAHRSDVPVITRADLERMREPCAAQSAAEAAARRAALEAAEESATSPPGWSARSPILPPPPPPSAADLARAREREEASDRARRLQLLQREEAREILRLALDARCMASREEQVRVDRARVREQEQARQNEAQAVKEAWERSEAAEREREEARSGVLKRGAAYMRRQVAEARAARAREEAEARAQSEAQLRRAQQQLEEERRVEGERKEREALELAGVMRENGRALQAKKDLRAREIEEDRRLAEILAHKAAREEAETARAAEALKKKDLDLARMWARHQRGLDIRAAEEELRIKKLVEEREAAEKTAIEAEEALRVRRAESLARELGAQLEERRERELERAAVAEKEAVLAREADAVAKGMREKETRELGEKKLAQRAALATQVDRRRRGEEAEAEKRRLDAEAERERHRQDLEVLEELRLQQLEELRDVPEKFKAQLLTWKLR